MEIAELGEFGLIERLTKDIKPENGSTIRGVGDDCAVLQYTGERRVLVTTDLLMEGVHFDLQYTPLKHLGYKSVMVNLSDIYAMMGTPRQITVSLAVSKRFSVEDIEALYSGMLLACQEHHVDLVGGDTTSSLTGLAISITAIGEARPMDITYRDGAKPTDLICVSGNLGAAYMGLQLLEREKAVYTSQVNELKRQIKEAENNGDSQKLSTLNSQLSTLSQPDFSGRGSTQQGRHTPHLNDGHQRWFVERTHAHLQAEQHGMPHLRRAHTSGLPDSSNGRGTEHERHHLCPQRRRGLRIAVHRPPHHERSGKPA